MLLTVYRLAKAYDYGYNGRVRRGRIVAECARLESGYGGNSIEGSNPSLSARNYNDCMKKRRVIIAHGWNDGSTNQWLNWLARELTARGYEVVQPVFSTVHVPNPQKWLAELAAAAGELDQQTVIVGYSLGVPTVLRYLHDYQPSVRIAGLVLVAGFGDGVGGRPAALFAPPLDWERLQRRSRSRICIYADNDYLVAPRRSQELARNLAAREILVVGGGHLIGMPIWPGSLKQFPAVLTALEDCYKWSASRWWYDVRLWMKLHLSKN